MLTNATLQALWQLARFDKPIGITLLLWPSLMGLWLGAADHPAWHLVIIFTLGVILTRAAGCVVNDLSDRDVDAQVARTIQRPLASGRLSVQDAWLSFVVLMLLALILASQLRWITLALAPLAATLMVVYPKCKRVTYLPQVVLGLAFSMGIIMAIIEVRGYLLWHDVYWILANTLWVVAYDTCYALADRADDRHAGIRSTALLFEDLTVFWVGVLQCLALLFWYKAGQVYAFDFSYWIALVVVGLMFVWQLHLISGSFPCRSLKAFKMNQWVGLLMLGAVFVQYL